MKDLKPASLMWVRRMSKSDGKRRAILAQIAVESLVLSGGERSAWKPFDEKILMLINRVLSVNFFIHRIIIEIKNQ